MLVSNCCGASAKGGEDYEICSECLEHCEYVDDKHEPNEPEFTSQFPDSHSDQVIDVMNNERSVP